MKLVSYQDLKIKLKIWLDWFKISSKVHQSSLIKAVCCNIGNWATFGEWLDGYMVGSKTCLINYFVQTNGLTKMNDP
jgi:hypothetical protein